MVPMYKYMNGAFHPSNLIHLYIPRFGCPCLKRLHARRGIYSKDGRSRCEHLTHSWYAHAFLHIRVWSKQVTYTRQPYSFRLDMSHLSNCLQWSHAVRNIDVTSIPLLTIATSVHSDAVFSCQICEVCMKSQYNNYALCLYIIFALIFILKNFSSGEVQQSHVHCNRRNRPQCYNNIGCKWSCWWV